MLNFWPFFYFCSDLPKFWYMSNRLIGKHLSFFFNGFLFFFGVIMYAKSVTSPSGFLCNSLLRRNKRTLLCSIKFLHTLFLENEVKTSETKNR